MDTVSRTPTIVYPPPRPITKEDMPQIPCWCWTSTGHYWAHWEHLQLDRDTVAKYGYTHWLPVPDLKDLSKPPPVADVDTGDDSLCNVRRLRAELAESNANVEALKGRLDAAEQHVKILTEDRDEAYRNLHDREDRLMRAGLASPRPEVKAARKTVVHPWKAEEVPLGCWLRWKTEPRCFALLGVGPSDIQTSAGENNLPYDYVAKTMECSIDGGKTWHPAGRVEEVAA